MNRTPLTLCHTCDVLFVHAGQTSVEAAHDHARDAHRDAQPGDLTFTDVGADPGILLACPRTVRG